MAYRFEHDGLGAESTVYFTANTERAATWLKVALGETIASLVMAETEIEP